ncbi:MAG: hypothetical protein ABSH12_08920, partial [Endomicrobiales bacterium]
QKCFVGSSYATSYRIGISNLSIVTGFISFKSSHKCRAAHTARFWFLSAHPTSFLCGCHTSNTSRAHLIERVSSPEAINGLITML